MVRTKIKIAVGIVWLFHLSGIIGMILGYSDWFLPKTPINLIICILLLIIAGDLLSVQKTIITLVFFSCGMFVEWLGVTFSFPFGEYYYGNNLGPKVDGVPYLIGFNWSILVIITGCMASQIHTTLPIKIILGASLMVFLDLFIEPNAANFDFWYWVNDRIPLSNYVGWFIIAAGLHWIYQKYMKEINFQFCLNLYLAQLAFFVSFYVESII
ncbi:MAG: carotenoid biosynthesis protein [Bacteroidota bacterium]